MQFRGNVPISSGAHLGVQQGHKSPVVLDTDVKYRAKSGKYAFRQEKHTMSLYAPTAKLLQGGVCG